MDMLDIDASNRVKKAMRDAYGKEIPLRLARATGLSRTTLERSLTGTRSFTVSELGKIARALGRRLKDVLPSDEDHS